MGRQPFTIGLVSILITSAAPLPVRAQTPPAAPRTLAFVVGIERYDDPELDKLQYAADDARKIFDQLKVVAELDPASKLLVADDDDKNSRLDADSVRTALQQFVQLIKDRTNVVVYLGGHGTLSPSRALWFLPSNYSRNGRTGYITFNEIQQTFADEINGRTLHDVSLTFFVNMCGAGNAVTGPGVAMRVDDNNELIDVARRVFREETFGLKRYALIPATPKERNTHEDDRLRSSVFAHHLREGLAGKAARNGMVTAGSLFDYLSANLGEDLPRNADFTADIPLGVTRRLEGESAYVMGTALLAAAEALVPAGADGERSAHRTALLDLAAEQFARVSEQAADLAARAVLRKAQTDVLRNRDPEIAQAQLDGLVARLGMQPAEAEELKQLLQSGDAQAPRTLRHLRDRLQAGEPFYALILDTVDIPAVKRSADPGAALWKKVLDELPGRRAIETGVIPIDSIDFARPPALPATVRETVNQWRATLKQAEPARLVVVYTGIATTSGLQRSGLSEGSPAESERQERILPFGRAEIELVIADWPGPVTVAYLGPFGGALLSGPPAGRDVSLLLAAREPNGMTFLGAMGATSNAALLARALQEGAEKVEEFPPLAEFNRQMEAGAKPFVPGTPLWIPRWGQPLVGSAAQDQLAPLKHFMLHAAAGCIVDSLQTCDGKRGKPDPFELLATAARSDLHNEHATAVNGYAQAARELRSAAAAASDLRGAAATRKALESLASTIERRTKGEERRRARRVVVLPVGVEDYISPLVPDLPGTSKDLTAYAGALTKAFHNVTLVVRNPRMIVKTDDLTGALRQEADGLGPEDLLILLYSGRGIELDGRRYLSTGSTEPCEAVDPRKPPEPCFAESWTQLVDLWTIAEMMRDRWFVGIYDAQFTQPVFEERIDELLDKHLNSVRRELAESPESIPGLELGARGRSPARRQTAGAAARLEFVPLGALPKRQLHMWVEGTVTAAARPPLECASKELGAIHSPLAAALIAELPPKSPGTYREWLERVSQTGCLAEGAHLMAQGDVDLPLFATGDGAELVDYFRSDDARRHANVYAAGVTAEAALERFSTNLNRLSAAAIYLALPTIHPTYSFGAERGSEAWAQIGTRDWLREASELLKMIRLSPETETSSEPFRSISIELLARRHVLAGDPAQARAELRDAPSAVLAERALAQLLVTLTDEAARRQPATLLEETSRLLEKAERELTDGGKKPNPRLGTARDQLDSLVRSEQSRRTTRFEIAPEAAGRER